MTGTELENLSLDELIVALRQIGASEDRMERGKEVEAVKSAFYRLLGKLKAEAEAAGENVEEKFSAQEEAFKMVYSDYKKEKSVYNREQDALRSENLEKKKAVLAKLKELVENLNDVQTAFPALREIQAEWRSIGPVPAADFRDINDTYQFLVEKFYDMVQINHELRDLDFKKNLEAKERFCEDAERLAESEDVVGAFAELQKLHEQWKELGPVAKEFRESIWERFKAATAIINKRYQAHFEDIKKSFAANLEAKEALCVKVEEIADKEDIKDAGQWNALSKEIEQIQAEWKKIGFATRKDNQKIYERFRAACNKFYDRKKEFFASAKSGIDAAIAAREELIAQAEAIKDSTDWKKTTDQFISLQKQWKELPAVPRKKGEQLWKRFRAACDAFFAERDKNGKPENDFYANLKAKKALIAEIKAYKPKEGESREKARAEFEERYKAIGFVPFKEKDAITKAYKDAMAEAFPQKEHSRKADLIRRYNALQQDIVTYENNIGFFSNSKNSEPLIRQMQERIESAKAELKEIEEQIRKEEAEA
ncbi:MAG: DUF349 domain-containing protein [Bacteroidales bacterium]|nr:DUF349 domain-containing protein [Bacteroidales bacterium]